MMRMFQLAPRVVVMRETGLRPALFLLNDRQHRNGYRLLAASRAQPTSHILPATLCEGEEQAQPEELAAWGDDWFKLIGRGKKTL